MRLRAGAFFELTWAVNWPLRKAGHTFQTCSRQRSVNVNQSRTVDITSYALTDEITSHLIVSFVSRPFWSFSKQVNPDSFLARKGNFVLWSQPWALRGHFTTRSGFCSQISRSYSPSCRPLPSPWLCRFFQLSCDPLWIQLYSIPWPLSLPYVERAAPLVLPLFLLVAR